MHLNIWKSVILSWANALGVARTTYNFIGDLSPQFFIKLCSYLKGVDVSTLQDAVSYITDNYKSLILGNKEDDNYETLLATAYLLLTSVHQTNDELCKRLCCVSNREQAQIRSVLEAFVDVHPSKITKELLFVTLAQLPEGPESCGNSPYLASSSSGSPNKRTPGTDDDTPHRQRRRSSRFKKVKHQLRMAMAQKYSLQDELDCAKEIISHLETVVSEKNQDIAKLKEQCQLLVNERERDVSWSSSNCKTPDSGGQDCVKCRSLERQISTYEDGALQDKSEIQELNETLATLTKKISKLESEKRTLDDQLQLCEDQIMQDDNEIAALKNRLEDFVTHKKELECIIEELREARSAANCSVDEDIPNNLGNEVIDLQLTEMRLLLEEKDRIIYEKDDNITNLNDKLEEKESEKRQFQQEAVDYQSSICKLEEAVTKYSNSIRNLEEEILELTSSKQLMASELQEVGIQKKVLEDGLRTSEEKLVELSHLIFDLKKQLEHDGAALEDCKKIISERDLMISSYLSTLELEAIRQKEFENRCMELEKTVSTKEMTIVSLEQKVQCAEESLVQEVEINTGLKEQCENLQSALTEKKAYITGLENEILHNQSLVQEMQKETESCQLKILTLDSNVKKLTCDYEQVTSQLLEVTKEKENIEHQLQESQLRVAAATDELKNQESELRKVETLCEERENLLLLKQETISSLEEEVVRCNEVVHHENEKNKTLLQEIQTHQLEVSRLETALKTYQQKIEHCDMIKQEVERENLKFKGNIDALEAEVLMLTNSNQLAVSELQGIVKEKKNIEERLRTTEDNIVELNELVDDLRKQLVQNKIQLEAALEDNEKLITERTQMISSYESSLKVETDKLEKYEKQCKDLEKTVASNEVTIGSLEHDFKNAEDSLQQEMDAHARLKEECETLQSTLVEKNAEISALEINALRNQSLIQEVEHKNELCQAKILCLDHNVEKLTSDYEQANSQLSEIQKENEDVKNQLQESHLRIATLSAELDMKVNDLQELKILFKEQENVLLLKNEKLSTLEGEVVSLTEVMRLVSEKKETLLQSLQSNQLEVERLETELEKTQKELEHFKLINQEIQLENSQHKESIDSLGAEILMLTNTNQMNTSELQNLFEQKKCVEDHLRTTEEKMVELNELVDELREQLDQHKIQLKAALEDKENIIIERTQMISTYQSSLKVEKDKREECEKRCMDLEKTIAVNKDNFCSLEREVKHTKESLMLKEELNATLKEECETLQSTLTESRAAISTLENKISRNHSAIQEMQQENEVCQEKILALNGSIKELTSDYELAASQLLEITKQKEDAERQLQESHIRIQSVSEELKQQRNIIIEQTQMMSTYQSSLKVEVDKREECEKRCMDLEKTIAVNKDNFCSLEQEVKHTKESLMLKEELNATLKEECETLQSTLTESRAAISTLENEISRNHSAIQEMQQENKVCQEKILALNGSIKELTSDYESAASQLLEITRQKEDAELQLQESHLRIQSVSEELKQQGSELRKIETLCKQQADMLLLKDEKVISLEGEVVSFTEVLRQEHEKYETLQQEVTKNQLEITRLETSVDTYQKDKERSELIKQEIELENSKYKENVNALEAEILKLTHSNEVTDAKLMKILEQKNCLEERLTALENELKEKACIEEKLHQDVIALQAALKKQVALVLTMEEDKMYHENFKLAGEKEKARMQSVIHSLQGEIERLTNENESATSLASSLKSETESLSRRLDNCSMDLDIKNETILMMETTLSSLNSKMGLLEATIKEKDSVISGAKSDLNDTKAALEKYREESQKKLDSRVDELIVVIQQKDAELYELREENESKCERIARMAEELLQVAQTFNIEKTSLTDHAKNLEDMLERSSSTEKELQNKIASLSKNLRQKENKLSHVNEKLTLTIELHTCEKRELTTKNKFLKTQLDEIKLNYDRLVKELEESNGEDLKGRISALEAESQELKDKLELKTKDIQWYEHELEVLQKTAKNTMKVNAQLEEEVKSLTRSKKQEVARLENEIAMLTEKIERFEPHACDISSTLRQEYEEKLEKLKAKMRKIYTEKVERMLKYQTGNEKMFADEELHREKQKRISLEAKVRQLSDQLLIVQEEKRALISNNVFRTPAYPLGGPISNPAYESPPLQKTYSLDRLPTTSHGLDNLGADLSLERSFSSRRTSTSSNRSSHVPRGIGKVFPAADEDGEVFDNRCLADLKEGICTLAPGPGGVDRMSILQQRNSMCPPHLKSSYPVESQFFTPNAKEDEIKVTARGNKENHPQDSRSVPGTPSKLRSLFSGRRKH